MQLARRVPNRSLESSSGAVDRLADWGNFHHSIGGLNRTSLNHW